MRCGSKINQAEVGRVTGLHGATFYIQEGNPNHLGSVSAIRQANGTVQATCYILFWYDRVERLAQLAAAPM
ncbi:MAG: hypothetical protein D6706_10365 [Chloroflexi bacterium]|nr:MAG: hypothetical protein D6706_10365 [Chloroflexota bacterium]